MERILIIEDELPMRTALQDVLVAEGYRVLTAPDGESGLQRAIDEKPDLILLDIMMPKLDGYAVCAELRRQTQGVGIGLSIVKHIVEAHGGQVLVRSAPGQGSRFTIELPVTLWNAS